MTAPPPPPTPAGAVRDWPAELYRVLKQAQIRQVSYVPDAGHARLIQMFAEDAGVRAVPLTTEEEGVALSAGAWLGGQRAVLLMQSQRRGQLHQHAVAAARDCRFPLLMLVTMRGEWGEFNPWQVPMGRGDPAGARSDRACASIAPTRPTRCARPSAAAAAAFDARPAGRGAARQRADRPQEMVTR